MEQALAAAQDDLEDTCISGTLHVSQVGNDFAGGGLFTVEVTCKIRGLGELGLDIDKTMTSQAASPLDPYRRSAG